MHHLLKLKELVESFRKTPHASLIAEEFDFIDPAGIVAKITIQAKTAGELADKLQAAIDKAIPN